MRLFDGVEGNLTYDSMDYEQKVAFQGLVNNRCEVAAERLGLPPNDAGLQSEAEHHVLDYLNYRLPSQHRHNGKNHNRTN